jgi:hypothetical protein
LSQTTQEFKTYVLVLSIFPEEEEECQILWGLGIRINLVDWNYLSQTGGRLLLTAIHMYYSIYALNNIPSYLQSLSK